MNTFQYLVVGLVVVGVLELTVGRPARRALACALVVVASIGALLTLQGCASVTNPDREIRLTEYSGTASPGLVGTPYVSGDLVVTGCRLVLSKIDGHGCLTYEGKACRYASAECDEHTQTIATNEQAAGGGQ